MGGYDLIAVGTSWGGLRALGIVLGALPPDLAAAVAVVQHRGAGPRSSALADLLARRTRLPVREVEDKDPISPGAIHLAPPDYHLLVEPEGFALSLEERVQYSRPSIDVLFESAADTRGERLVAVVLTGANTDGAAGLVRVRERGGLTVVQSPASAERPEMPAAAIATGAADEVLSLELIGPYLADVCAADAPGRTR